MTSEFSRTHSAPVEWARCTARATRCSEALAQDDAHNTEDPATISATLPGTVMGTPA